MKRTLAVLLAMIMVLSAVPFALAENETPENELEDNLTDEELEEEAEDAGVTPDNPVLWGLDRAIERTSLALTFNKAAKAKKGLAYAQERLMEVKLMQEQKKLDKANKSVEAYEDLTEEAAENVEEMGDGDPEAELEDTVEIEEKTQLNKLILNTIRLNVKNLNETQQAQVQEMLQAMEGVTSQFAVKVQENKNKVKIKIKAEKGATDEEIKALEYALKAGMPLAQVRIVKQGTGVIKERGSDKNKTAEVEDEDEAEDNETETSNKGKKGSHTESEDEVEDESEDEVEDEVEGNETGSS